MTVDSIMNRNPKTVPMTETFGGAFAILMDLRIDSLPVVDTNGIYRGMFDLEDIWELLLPRAAMLGLKSLTDLAFVSDAKEAMHQKLQDAGARPVSEFLDAQVQPVHADTPVKEAILLFYKHQGDLPVVDRASKRLLGTVSPWEILQALR
ncbi:MAG: CBS domain-containing protein [Acidobacteria bacterium]|nr:CBS domain-containing protein [Acidobacteriota bacterium]